MLRPRISPALLIHNGELVKTERFRGGRYLGDPINAVKIFTEKGADELSVYDIGASAMGRGPDFDLIALLAAECRMPFCYGGGISRVSEAVRLVSMGVEKVAIGTAALTDPDLVREIALAIGSQSICVVLDWRRDGDGAYQIYTSRGTQPTGRSLLATAAEMIELGAGEIVFNSIDRDGTMAGYDLDLAALVARTVSTPFTFLGGAGSLTDMAALYDTCGDIGISAGSLFVFKGPLKAVLINYPDWTQRESIYRRAMTERELV